MEILKWPFVTVLLPDNENVKSSDSGKASAGFGRCDSGKEMDVNLIQI